MCVREGWDLRLHTYTHTRDAGNKKKKRHISKIRLVHASILLALALQGVPSSWPDPLQMMNNNAQQPWVLVLKIYIVRGWDSKPNFVMHKGLLGVQTTAMMYLFNVLSGHIGSFAPLELLFPRTIYFTIHFTIEGKGRRRTTARWRHYDSLSESSDLGMPPSPNTLWRRLCLDKNIRSKRN